MRKSVNISESTRALVNELKEIKYPNMRVTDSYVINQSVKGIGVDVLNRRLRETSQNKQYQSIRYTFDFDSNKILSEMMSRGFTADSILSTAMNLSKKFELYKRRYRLIKDELKIGIHGTNEFEFNCQDFLPMIYSISIATTNDISKNEILYVGKTKLFAEREATHIISVIDNPQYLGLTDDDLKNENLSLQFDIVRVINVLECDSLLCLERQLSEEEAEQIRILKPITQKGMNMKDNLDKRSCVENAIQKLLSEEEKKY